MSVPNLFIHVQAAHRDFVAAFGPLDSHQRCGEFGEFAIARLHAINPHVGHLRKHPGQTQYNGHAVDAALYKLTGQAIDIIGASKIASPTNHAQPAWGVDEPRYTSADWIDPKALPPGDEEGDTTPPPPRKPEPEKKEQHVCPVGVPKHSYADTLSLANDLDSAYRAETGRTVHPEPLAHWIWRYQFENYSRDALIAQAVARGIEEA